MRVYVKIYSITEINYRHLKSDHVIAAISLCPVGLTKKTPFKLERFDSYSDEVVSFPVARQTGLFLRIALLCKSNNYEEIEFAEVKISLEGLKVNRWARTSFRMTTLCETSPPLIGLTLQLSEGHVAPFMCPRGHVEVEKLHVSDDAAQNVGNAVAAVWMRMLTEEQWPLVLRPGFLDRLRATVGAVRHERGDYMDHVPIVPKMKPRRVAVKGLPKVDECPLWPPEPTSDFDMPVPPVRDTSLVAVSEPICP